MTIAPPHLIDDECSRFFWHAAARHELQIQRCQRCGIWIHLPRPVCRTCGSFDLQGEAVSGRATLYSYSTTHKAFHPFFAGRLPYTIATVELVEQPNLHVLSQLVDVEEPAIGMSLVVAFQPLAEGIVIPVFTAAPAKREETQ